MIQVLNVKVLNETGTEPLFDYSPDLNIANEMLLDVWIKIQKDKYETMLDCKVKIDVHRRQRPNNGVGVVNIAEIVIEHMRVPSERFFSKSRREEVVLARVIAFNIAKECDFTPTEITDQLNFDRTMYYHYVKNHNNYTVTDKEYDKKYRTIKADVLDRLYLNKTK